MKKLLLLFILFFSTSVLFAQGLNQPSVFNNQCDTNNDGIETFNLLEISSEILAGLNSNDYVIMHYLTQADAANSANPLPNAYTNFTNPQSIFVRVVNTITSEVQYLTYVLHVNPLPMANPQTLTACDGNGDGFASFNLDSLIVGIIGNQPNTIVTFHETPMDAQVGINSLSSPYSNIIPFQQNLYFRVQNTMSGCYSVGTVNLLTSNCQQAGQPVNLSQCINNGQTCFDLASNDSNIMGSLNPSNYTISYHITQANAQIGFNALTSPYCTVNNSQVIYARLKNNADQTFQIFTFTVTSQTVSANVTILANMDQCDDNNDGAVIFNLTNIQAQINSSNSLAYYLNAQMPH